MLTYLSGVAKGPVQRVEVLINVITVTFDMNQPTQVREQWLGFVCLFVFVCQRGCQPWLPLGQSNCTAHGGASSAGLAPPPRRAGDLTAAPPSLPPTHPLQNAMTVPNWNRCAQTMFDIMALLGEHRHISLTDTPPEEERVEEPEAGTPTQLWGNLGAFLERLDDEWNGSLKARRVGGAGERAWAWAACSLPPARATCLLLQWQPANPVRPCLPPPPQALDPHANEYMERLRDEAVLLALAQQVSAYLQQQGELDKLAGVALKRIQHFYYKTGARREGRGAREARWTALLPPCCSFADALPPLPWHTALLPRC